MNSLPIHKGIDTDSKRFLFIYLFITGLAQSVINDLCLGCICEATSYCNQTLRCEGDVCGLFKITKGYWIDAGKPVLANDDPSREGGKRFTI